MRYYDKISLIFAFRVEIRVKNIKYTVINLIIGNLHTIGKNYDINEKPVLYV